MKRVNRSRIMRKTVSLGFCLHLLAVVSVAQPIISGIDKTSGTVDEEVTISGLNLPTGADAIVRFGGSEAANIVSSSSSLIVAEVPAGASYGPISVTSDGNAPGSGTALTGYSSQHFLMSFSGGTFSAAAMGAQLQFPTADIDKNIEPFDLTIADFDGNGLVDIVRTNDNDSEIDIYRNTSTAGAISFTRTTFGGAATRNADSGDLDGDGLPDLVMTQGNNADVVFINRNTSTVGNINFASAILLNLPKSGDLIRIARRPIIADLDRDGKPEITVTNETDNIIYIFQNNSTVGSISFSATPIEIVATGSTVGMSGLDVKDLNNDGFPEIVANPLIGSPNVFVFRNTSFPGTISIQAASVVEGPSGLVNSVVGDFDNDGFNDIASTSGSSNAVIIFRNTTTQAGGAITMASAQTVLTSRLAPNGIGLGDLNGDGLVDIAVGHEDQTNPSIVVLTNTTSGGTISFNNDIIATAANNRNIKIADLDDDGRPDISFVHDILNPLGGNLSVFRNANCVVPVLDPLGPLTVCTNANIVIDAPKTRNMTYAWVDELAGPGVVGTASSITADTDGTPTSLRYNVTISDGGACAVQAAAGVVVTVDPAATVTPAIVTNTVGNVLCVGTELNLSTTTPSQGFEWSGPNGFTSTEANPIIAGIEPEQAGEYKLRVTLAPSGCLSDEATEVITVQNVPEPVVVNTNGPNFCDGTTITLTTPNYSGFTYSWNNGDVATGNTTTSIDVNATGSFSAVISDGTCTLESPAEAVSAIAPPTSSFTSVDAICVALPVTFEATSTGADGFTLNYNWDFDGAGGTATGAAPDPFTYNSAGTFTPTLTTGYDELAGCTGVANKSLAVQAVPVVTINAQDAGGMDLTEPFEKCPSDEVTFSADITLTGIQWTVSGSTDVLSTEATFSTATVGTYALTGTDPVGCVINSEATIENFPESGLVVTSPDDPDGDLMIELDEDQTLVELSVSGGSNYMWVPEEIVSDPTSSMVEVFPFEVSTTLTVTGTDINDCVESSVITITNPFVEGRKTFSPNGDGIGDCWEITNSSTLNNCTVIIFDSRGRQLVEIDSPFTEDCVWDGNFSGSPVPEGVYYFAMKCEDNQFERSGSILLAR